MLHQDLAAGRWHQLSLAEQLGNIGSEVGRAGRAAKINDEKLFASAVARGLELFDLTLEDLRWRSRLREINRAKEVFCDVINGGKEFGSSFKDLDRYFLDFALLARRAV